METTIENFQNMAALKIVICLFYDEFFCNQ